MKTVPLFLIIAVVFLYCCSLPVSAILPEMTCKGQVSTVSIDKNTLTIKNPERYGCDYPATGDPVCSWTPLSTSALTGTVPDPAAFSIFSGAEMVVATSIGDNGGRWITLAKVYSAKESQQLVTDIVGDPGTVPLPLIGNYSVDTTTVPDCSACSGTICSANQAHVTVKSSGNIVQEKTIGTGESIVYNGRNDGSSVNVKFISGEASSSGCGTTGMTGPQAISVFVISVTPPVGFGQVNDRTPTPAPVMETSATTLVNTTAVTTTPTFPATASLPTSTQTPAAGMLPLAASGAVISVALLMVKRH